MRQYYTNGIEIITLIHKSDTGHLVKDQNSNMVLLSDLKRYRLLDDRRTITDWYQDSKDFLKQHPLAAFFTAASVFFGLTNFN